MKRNIVGHNIRRLRLANRMTQEKLALEGGLSQGYINQLESGRRRYTQKTLELIAGALSTPLAELFREEDKDYSSATRVTKNRKKRPSRREFLAVLEKLPDHVVEHYFTLLKMECEILKRQIQKSS